tara:strand:+ start:6418 stop:7458 length:1041 start_codon:yes stop_codon:yes gene_type:complete
VGFNGDNYPLLQSIDPMSDDFYLKMRKIAQHNQRKGAFPFPTYAEALFSQVLVSRRVLSSSFERPSERTPVASRGPEVAPSSSREITQGQALKDSKQGPGSTSKGLQEKSSEQSLQNSKNGPKNEGKKDKSLSEKKQLFQSLDKFIDQKINGSDKSSVSFPGGEISKNPALGFSDGSSVKLTDLEELAGDRPIIYDHDAFEGSDLSVIFVGERPKDFDDENPKADLLSKMISAMKLKDTEYSRIFLSKDPDMARSEWYKTLQLLDGRMQLCIVPLGAKATNTILGTKERLSKIHGQQVKFKIIGHKTEIDLSVYPVFHPDFLQINPNMKRSAWIDLQKVMGHLGIN